MIDRAKLIDAIRKGIEGNPKMRSTIGTPMEGREGEIADKMIRVEASEPNVMAALKLYLGEDYDK